jgi:hypothetical protein
MTSNKNPNVIEEHVMPELSANSSTTNEQSNNNSNTNIKKQDSNHQQQNGPNVQK